MRASASAGRLPSSRAGSRERSVLRMVLTAAILVAVAFLVGVLALQERMAYQPPREVEPTPAGAERADYVAADGQPLYAYVFPAAPSAGAPLRVVLAFHGNAD